MTIDVLEQYDQALGGRLELTVVHGRHSTPLLGDHTSAKPARSPKPSPKTSPMKPETSPWERRKSA